MYKLKNLVSSLNYVEFKNGSILDCDYIFRTCQKEKEPIRRGIIMNGKTKIVFSNVSILELSSDCFSQKDNYYIQLNFNQNAKMVKKRVGKEKRKYLEENNIEIFDGTIYSNKIPLVVK